jgi:hypothetical protein
MTANADDEERDRTLGSRVWFKGTLHLNQVIEFAFLCGIMLRAREGALDE